MLLHIHVYVNKQRSWKTLAQLQNKSIEELREEREKSKKQTPKTSFFHRLNKTTEVITIPTNTPTTLTTPHLIYPSNDFLVIDGSNNVTPLKEYKTIPVTIAMME